MNYTKILNSVIYSILAMLILAVTGIVLGVDLQLQLHTNQDVIVTKSEILKLSSILQTQANANTDPTIIPDQQTQNLQTKKLELSLVEFFQWMAAVPETVVPLDIDTKNTILIKLLQLTVEQAENNAYIKNNIETIKIKDELTSFEIANFLEIACILDFAPAIKMALAKALAIDLYKNKQINKTATYDIELIEEGAKAVFTNLSDAAKGLIRYEYLLMFEKLLDSGVFQIARPGDEGLTEDQILLIKQQQNAHTLYIIRQLIQSKILPGKEPDLAGLETNNINEFNTKLTQKLARIFYNQQKLISTARIKQWASNALLLKTFVEKQYKEKFKDLWITILPKYIQNSVSLELLKLNSKASVALEMKGEDLETAVLTGLIPRPENTRDLSTAEYSANVKKYVDDHLHKFTQKSGALIISNEVLKKLPPEFKQAFACHFHCRCLKFGKILWLDGKEIYVPITYLNGYELTTYSTNRQLWQDLDTEEKVKAQQVKEKTIWAWANGTPKSSLKNITKEEWIFLAEHGRLPSLSDYTNFRQIGKYIVDNYINPYFWNSKFQITKTKDSDEASDWINALPEELQKEIARYYQCLMIKNKTPNRKLDNKDLVIPISYLIETGILTSPGKKNRDLAKDMDETSLAKLYIYDLNSMSEPDALKFIENIPQCSILPIAQQYALSSNQNPTLMEKLTKVAGAFELSLETLLKTQNPDDLVKSGALDLSNLLITEMVATDFDKFRNSNDITKLVISKTLIKEIPAGCFDKLTGLESIEISNNKNLITLPAKLFEKNTKLKTIKITNNSNLKSIRRVFDNFNSKLDLVDLSGNSLTEATLSNLQTTSFKLNNNKLNKVPELNKAITELHLQNNELTDIVNIAILNQLQYLDLSNNKISKVRPFLDKLTTLRYLFLAYNKNIKLQPEQEQKVQTEDERKIQLTNLNMLDISNCNIVELNEDCLNFIPNVKIIIANKNAFSGNKFTFKGLSKLEQLYIGRSNITELNQSNMDKLSKLKVLGLEGNNLTKLEKNSFFGCPNLEELYLFLNPLNNLDVNAFNGLTNLKNLDLSYNKLTTLNPETFIHNSALQRLNLRNNQIEKIEGSSFKLKNLQILNLENNGIKSVGWGAFNGIPAKCIIRFNGNNAVGWTKPISSIKVALTGGISPITTSVEREWYNKNILLDTLLVGAGAAAGFAALTFLPALALPTYAIYTAYGAVATVGGAGVIDGGVRGARRAWLATKNNFISWFTSPTTPEFQFNGKTDWPPKFLDYKNWKNIDAYFENLHKAYQEAIEGNKSDVIEIKAVSTK